jgi:hypothetical protein
MDTPIVKAHQAKIQLQIALVQRLKNEMDKLYEDYDAKVGPKTCRETEAAIEAVCWAKEEQYNAAKHELSLMQIKLWNHMKLVNSPPA